MRIRQFRKSKDLITVALCSVLITICSWITIPTIVPFTLQTFAIFLIYDLFGGKCTTCSVLLYLLLGLAGFPVFSGFCGGVGVLLGSRGGYLSGFLLASLFMWASETLFGKKLRILFMLLGLFFCYLIGTLWFWVITSNASDPASLFLMLKWCIAPFILPDLVKLSLACNVGKRLRRFLYNS